MNLITKLTEKLKVVGYKLSDVAQSMLNKIHTFGNSKVAKTLKTLTLCGVMAFSIATMSACNNTPTVDPGHSTVQPGDNENLKQYSQILQTVLTDSYYTKLADNAMSNSVNVMEYSDIPYSFLERQGYNISTIKQGALGASAVYYTLKEDQSNLYCRATVKTPYQSSTYDSQYILKYSISKQELDNLSMLIKGKYIQAPLFLQELDRTHEAEIISCVNVDSNTADAVYKFCSNNQTVNSCLKSGKINFVNLTNIYKQDDFYFAEIQLGYLPSGSVASGQLGTSEICFFRDSYTVFENNILSAKKPNNIGIFAEDFGATLQNIISYNFSPNNFIQFVVNK